MESSQIPIPPQQGRAKATLERILSATEELLAEQPTSTSVVFHTESHDRFETPAEPQLGLGR
jgi:hypothetical protein